MQIKKITKLLTSIDFLYQADFITSRTSPGLLKHVSTGTQLGRFK
ncbi:MAG: hypothetical protein ACTSU4_07285 [Promethearchaeota archaeon]